MKQHYPIKFTLKNFLLKFLFNTTSRNVGITSLWHQPHISQKCRCVSHRIATERSTAKQFVSLRRVSRDPETDGAAKENSTCQSSTPFVFELLVPSSRAQFPKSMRAQKRDKKGEGNVFVTRRQGLHYFLFLVHILRARRYSLADSSIRLCQPKHNTMKKPRLWTNKSFEA